MALPTIKQYTITGGRWNDHRLEIQNAGVPFLWINSNNRYGPWRDPYMTIHQNAQNGPTIAAAKMGCPGLKRDFKVFHGNPDCTDLATWPVVKCLGRWAHDYRFCVEVEDGLLRFAWRRTRDKRLGASRKWHRDFKLVAVDSLVKDEVLERQDNSVSRLRKEVHLLDLDADGKIPEENLSIEELDGCGGLPAGNVLNEDQRLLGVYIHDPKWGSSPRQARINFFDSLPPEVELHCLTVVMGLQEKISRNQDAFTCYSVGYGGCLRGLGNYDADARIPYTSDELGWCNLGDKLQFCHGNLS